MKKNILKSGIAIFIVTMLCSCSYIGIKHESVSENDDEYKKPIESTVINETIESLEKEEIKINETTNEELKLMYEAEKESLNNIRYGVQPGSAGATLKLMNATYEVLNWAKDTELSSKEIKKCRDEYIKELEDEDAEIFMMQLSEIKGEYERFTDPEYADYNAKAIEDIGLGKDDISFPIKESEALEALVNAD